MQKRSRSVLLFRAAKHPEDPYSSALKEASLSAHFVPALHFQYTNQDALSSALLHASRYSALVLTSQTAVEAIRKALGSEVRELLKPWASQPVFVVGKATSQAVSDELGLKSCGGFSGNAESLSQVIINHFSPTTTKDGPPLLFPCSQLKRETLPSALAAAGLGLEAQVCYHTEPHPQVQENVERVMGQLREEGEESVCAVFFSPSGVSFALDKFLGAAENIAIKLVAIGPTTAEALSSHGHPPAATATKPTPQSLLEALQTLQDT